MPTMSSDAPDALAITGTRGEVRFEGVDFGYDPARLILRGVDLDIATRRARGVRRRHRGG